MNIQREEQQREKTLAREQQRQAEKEAKRVGICSRNILIVNL